MKPLYKLILIPLLSFNINAEVKLLICDQFNSPEIFSRHDQKQKSIIDNGSEYEWEINRAKLWFESRRNSCKIKKVFRTITITFNDKFIDVPGRHEVETIKSGCDVYDAQGGVNAGGTKLLQSTPTNLRFCEYIDCRYGIILNREDLTALNYNNSSYPELVCRIEEKKTKNKI